MYSRASLVFGALAALAVVIPGATRAQQLSAADRAVAVARLWAEARYNEAAWDLVRADWDSALAANLTLADLRQPDALFFRRLRRMLALLGDGQAAIRPPGAVRARAAWSEAPASRAPWTWTTAGHSPSPPWKWIRSPAGSPGCGCTFWMTPTSSIGSTARFRSFAEGR